MRLFILVLVAFGSSVAFSMPSEVIIIRHGEKQDGNLSKRGERRARALVEYFERDPEVSREGLPTRIFAFKPQKGRHRRAVQTMEPLAEDIGIRIDSSIKKQNVDDLVATIGEGTGRVAVCWGHEYIPEIAEKFGVRNAPRWADDTYDRTWILKFNSDGRLVSFRDLPQHLLPGDSDR